MNAKNAPRLGIEAIASYIPSRRIENADKAKAFGMDLTFLSERIGIAQTARREDSETCSDMCVKAFASLQKQNAIDIKDIDVIIVITQNPDHPIPHASAIVHGKLKASDDTACFDISLGCSGYIYGLSVILSFMESNGFAKGLLFTSDSYSEIIDPEDKDTSLLFGDAATVTLISSEYRLKCSHFSFGTSGEHHDKLIVRDKHLVMDGRSVFQFAAQFVPKDVKKVLESANLDIQDIDAVLLHQGSRYIVETIAKRLGAPLEKVPFAIANYGNTVSSSIPLLLETYCGQDVRLVASGYGLGLSWASCLIEKK